MRLQLTPFALAFLVAAGARADGTVSLRGAYYKERSTRVQQPMVDAQLDVGRAGRLDAHALIDVITSASPSTGARIQSFTEQRYEVGVGYQHELAGRLKLGGDFRYSTESDYFSTFVAARGELALFEQNTVLRAVAGVGRDRITNGVEVAAGALGTPRREEHLTNMLFSLSGTQLLGPTLVASLTGDVMVMDGFQANIYRVVFGGPLPVPERVPDFRLRAALAAGLRAYLPSRTAAVVSYRFYADDWGILGHTPEVRLVKELARGLELRARYRFHAQSAAEFWRELYTAEEIADPTRYVTEDEKLSAFTTHTVGGQLGVTLDVLGATGGFGDARLDFVVDRVWQSTAFGPAWVGQVGLSFPLRY